MTTCTERAKRFNRHYGEYEAEDTQKSGKYQTYEGSQQVPTAVAYTGISRKRGVATAATHQTRKRRPRLYEEGTSPTEHRSSRCVSCAMCVGVCAEGERMTVVVLWQLEMGGFLDKAVFIRR